MLLCKKRVIHNLVNSHCHFGPVGQIGLSAGNVNAVTHVTWNLTVTSRIFSNLDILKKFLKILLSSASCGGGQRTKSRNCMNGKVGTGNCQSGGEQTTENCNIEGL